MEELTENAEEPDEGESKQSEQKLGKLQYKVNTFIIIPFLTHIYVRTYVYYIIPRKCFIFQLNNKVTSEKYQTGKEITKKTDSFHCI